MGLRASARPPPRPGEPPPRAPATPWVLVAVGLLLLSMPAVAAAPAPAPPTGSGTSGGPAPAPLPRALASLLHGAGPAEGRTVACALTAPGSAACAPEPRVPPVPASGPAPTWENASARSGGAPPAGSGAAMAWDPVDGEVVYFGGCDPHACPDNQTWAFRGGQWTNLTDPARAPPAEASGSLAFDAAPDVDSVVLFGGCGVVCPMNETWWFSGGVWTNVSAPLCFIGCSWPPAPETLGSLAPANDGSLLLFGGCALATCASLGNRTYEYVDAGAGLVYWAPVSAPVAPSPRFGAALAFDPLLNRTLLFGGCDTVGRCALHDTWSYANASWTNLSGSLAAGGLSPPGLGLGAVTYDSASLAILLVGGLDSTGALSDGTWALACPSTCAWTELTPARSPPPDDLAAMATTSTTVRPLLVGGPAAGSNASGLAWVFEPALSLSVGAVPSTTVPARTNLTLVSTLLGGTPPWNESIDLGDGVTAPGPGNVTASYSVPGRYLVRASVTDAYGAEAFAPPIVVNATGPSARVAADPAAADVGEPVTWNATDLTGGTPPYSLDWAFGDGTTALGAPVAHAYATPGVYTVLLTGTDATGLAFEASGSISVSPRATVTASVLPTGTDPGFAVAFSSAVAGGTAPFAYLWSFGDGSTAIGPAPSHAYDTAGTYGARVTVTDGAGATAVGNVSVTVDPPLEGSLAPPRGALGIGRSVVFHANATGGTAPYAYAWSFGDGSRATGPDPAYAYSAVGSFRVTVWMNDSVGSSVVRSTEVTVGTGAVVSGGWLPVLVLVPALAIAGVAAGTSLRSRRRAPPAGGAVPPPGAVGLARDPGAPRADGR